MKNPFQNLSFGNMITLTFAIVATTGALAIGQFEILNNKADIQELSVSLEKNDVVDQELVGRFIRIETNQNHMLELLKDLKK